MSNSDIVGETIVGTESTMGFVSMPDQIVFVTDAGETFELASNSGNAHIIAVDGQVSNLIGTPLLTLDSSRNVFYGTAKFVFTTAKGSVTITWDDADFGDVEVRQC